MLNLRGQRTKRKSNMADRETIDTIAKRQIRNIILRLERATKSQNDKK